MPISQTFFNGNPATVADLAALAFAGHAHFTAMQVRDGSARGLDLHLNRLADASLTLYGTRIPDARIRELLARAVTQTPPDASLTCYISTRTGEFRRPSSSIELDVLVRTGDPVTPPSIPVTLAPIRHQRYLPGIKHVGEIAKTDLLWAAIERGFDDAVFLDETDRISEATIWNIAFWNGESVIWPEADQLSGITLQILQRRLTAMGVPQITRPIRPGDLHTGIAAALMNSWSPGVPVARIGEQRLAEPGTFTALLHRAYAAEPPVALQDTERPSERT